MLSVLILTVAMHGAAFEAPPDNGVHLVGVAAVVAAPVKFFAKKKPARRLIAAVAERKPVRRAGKFVLGTKPARRLVAAVVNKQPVRKGLRRVGARLRERPRIRAVRRFVGRQ